MFNFHFEQASKAQLSRIRNNVIFNVGRRAHQVLPKVSNNSRHICVFFDDEIFTDDSYPRFDDQSSTVFVVLVPSGDAVFLSDLESFSVFAGMQAKELLLKEPGLIRGVFAAPVAKLSFPDDVYFS